jgi:hypothetical protein
MNADGGDWSDEASPLRKHRMFKDPGLRRDDGSDGDDGNENAPPDLSGGAFLF